MASTEPIKLAVVTGAHPFDVPGFHALFRGYPDIDPYFQDLENWVHDWGQVRRQYDVTVFYNMHMDMPTCPIREALEELPMRPKGVFILHHALLAWPDLPVWSDLVGIKDRSFAYHPEQMLPVQVAKPHHPVVGGLTPWTMPEETYIVAEPDAASEVLLTTDHPLSMKSLAWTRYCGQARVFCFQCGHDRRAWEHPSFREVVARAIRWCAGRLD